MVPAHGVQFEPALQLLSPQISYDEADCLFCCCLYISGINATNCGEAAGVRAQYSAQHGRHQLNNPISPLLLRQCHIIIKQLAAANTVNTVSTK